MVTRRSWRHIAIGLVLLATGSLVFSAGVISRKGRAKADNLPTKQRRIIVNDDGEVGMGKDVLGMHVGTIINTVEEFLAERFNDCLNTQVDSYFLNINGTDRGPVHDGHVLNQPQSSMAQFFYWGERGQIHPDTDKMIRALIDRAHENGMEVFASIRMNDIHDSWKPKLSYPLKLQRPDLLIGEKHGADTHPEDAMMYFFWSALNYAKPEVREHFSEFVISCCREYDYDGVELDFFRHPHFFRPGEVEQNIDTMTGFVRQIRKDLNEIGRQRGRDYLLTVRSLDTPSMCIKTGLDVERWLKEGLLDMLMVGGGYIPYAGRLKEFVDMAHSYGIPAYPSINHLNSPIEAVSKASNFWALGADGVYVFNYSSDNWKPTDETDNFKGTFSKIPHQLGSPDTLLGVDKEYLPDNGVQQPYCGYNVLPERFPVAIVYGIPIELVVGDDIHKAATMGILQDIRLAISVKNLESYEEIAVKINGKKVPAPDINRTNAQQFDAMVQPSLLRRGINEIVIVPGPHSIGRISSVVTGFKLSVNYNEK